MNNYSTNLTLEIWTNASDKLRLRVGIWMLLISLFGTPANLLVLECARRLLIQTRECQIYQYFVCSMTAADFLFVSIFSTSMFAMYSFENLRLSPYQCAFVYGVCHLSSVASSLSLFCLNLDKYLAITKPLKHTSIMTRERVLRLIAFCWLLSIGWSIFFVTALISKSTHGCGMLLAPFTYYCIFTVTFFIGPTLAAFCLSICVAVITCKRPLDDQKFQMDDTKFGLRKISARSTNTLSSDSRKSSTHNRPIVRPVRTLTFVFATTAWSFVTCVPYRIMYLYYVSLSDRSKIDYLPVTFGLFSLMASNSLGNPLITILTQSRYLNILKCYWRKFLATENRYQIRHECRRSLDSEHKSIAITRRRRSVIEKNQLVVELGTIESGVFAEISDI